MKEEMKQHKMVIMTIQEYLNRKREERKKQERDVKVLTIFEHNVMIQK